MSSKRRPQSPPAMPKEPITEEPISILKRLHFHNATYEVKSVVPYLENPVLKTYEMSQHELDEYLDGYNEYGEFIVSLRLLPDQSPPERKEPTQNE